MKVSLLVPLRDDLGGVRDTAWKWIEKRWRGQHPDWEVIVSADDGLEPFSKTTAVNNAYYHATGDVFVVADADAWMDTSLDEAVDAAGRGTLVIPWNRVFRLTQQSSEYLLQNPAAPVTKAMKQRVEMPGPRPITAGTLYVISREAFERVEGMDPRFRGYRYEDVSFRRACDVVLGATVYQRSQVMCLWHPRDKKASEAGREMRVWGEHDDGILNNALMSLYLRAERRPRDMERLCAQHPLVPDKSQKGMKA